MSTRIALKKTARLIKKHHLNYEAQMVRSGMEATESSLVLQKLNSPYKRDRNPLLRGHLNP